MLKFKIGDIVRRINTSQAGIPIGGLGKIIRYVERSNPGNNEYWLDSQSDASSSHNEKNLELVEEVLENNNKNIMTSIIEKIKISLKLEPEMTLVTRGLMNIDESLTSEGKTLLDHILVQEYKGKMKEAVDKVPVEK